MDTADSHSMSESERKRDPGGREGLSPIISLLSEQ